MSLSTVGTFAVETKAGGCTWQEHHLGNRAIGWGSNFEGGVSTVIKTWPYGADKGWLLVGCLVEDVAAVTKDVERLASLGRNK